MAVAARATRAHVRTPKQPSGAQAQLPLAPSSASPPPTLSLTLERGGFILRLGNVPVGSVACVGSSPRHTTEWMWKTYATGQVPDREEAITSAFGAAWSLTDWVGRLWSGSRVSFGPGPLTRSLSKRVRTVLTRLEKGPPAPDDWLVVAILALDGYGRCGGTARALIESLDAMQAEHFTRETQS